MAKAMQKYICENFDGTETMNIQPRESFPMYGISNITRKAKNLTYIQSKVKYRYTELC